jgi:hypothetical protein
MQPVFVMKTEDVGCSEAAYESAQFRTHAGRLGLGSMSFHTLLSLMTCTI